MPLLGPSYYSFLGVDAISKNWMLRTLRALKMFKWEVEEWLGCAVTCTQGLESVAASSTSEVAPIP